MYIFSILFWDWTQQKCDHKITEINFIITLLFATNFEYAWMDFKRVIVSSCSYDCRRKLFVEEKNHKTTTKWRIDETTMKIITSFSATITFLLALDKNWPPPTQNFSWHVSIPKKVPNPDPDPDSDPDPDPVFESVGEGNWESSDDFCWLQNLKYLHVRLLIENIK